MNSGGVPDDDQPYRGIVAERAMQWGHTLSLEWAPVPTTNLSVRRMIEMLRATANDLEKDLP
jgi:hypothetical protein